MNWLLPLVLLVPWAISGNHPPVDAVPPAIDIRSLPDSVMEEVRREYQAGRFWHGVVRMREALGDGLPEMGEELLLLARGEAGWGNWAIAAELLQRPLTEGDLAGPEPWFLLGRALEETGDAESASGAYSRSLDALADFPGELGGVDPVEVHLRRARTGLAVGDADAALKDLGTVLQGGPVRGRWLALELAEAAASAGLPEPTLAFLSLVTSDEIRGRGWDLPARALLASGDSLGAEGAYWAALPSLNDASERGRAWERVGALRIARDDSLGARAAFHQVLREDPRGGLAIGAASALLTLGYDSASVARLGAEALARGGRERDALHTYEVYAALRGGDIPRAVTLAIVRIRFAMGEPREALSLLESIADEEGAPAPADLLVLRVRALKALGGSAAARAVEDSIIARFPERPEAVEILFLRADALHDRGDLQSAIQGFEATAALAPSQNLAGQARMRLGQIHLTRGRGEEAVRVFQEYLETFPDGRRWDEAAFWAGRTLISLGREEEGFALLEQLRGRFALSYYAIQAGSLLDTPYDPPIPETESTSPTSDALSRGLDRIDALRKVGLVAGADWEVRRLTESLRAVEPVGDRMSLLLRLALELNDRGLTREGINLGWEVQRLGGEWSRDLLSAIYPFPYREMVMREAGELNLDPFLMAGLMRQESAFWHEARSRADARGLMQVLPGTGRELARARGPRGFNADEHLYRPEINLHLGMNFFFDLRRRFGEDLSIVLSAYNAGPTRATRWREYPEAGDLPRFVERIPFSETRGYVKNVLLNREVYAWLYGEAGGATAPRPRP